MRRPKHKGNQYAQKKCRQSNPERYKMSEKVVVCVKKRKEVECYEKVMQYKLQPDKIGEE